MSITELDENMTEFTTESDRKTVFSIRRIFVTDPCV